MESNSKRGAALAYAIVITAALLVFASALISVAQFNLSASQNSLEGRQAYLDAKSAIEYGRAYLKLNPDKADKDFTILRADEGTGFLIGGADAADAVASYDGTKKTISAAAKYKSSDRVRTLGYQFTATEPQNPSSSDTDFVIVGATQFNGVPAMRRWNSGAAFYQGKSVSPYTVCFQYPVQLEGNSSLTAPQIYFMGTDGSNASIYGYTGSLSLDSDFIYLSGNVTGQNYSETNRMRLKLSRVGGILYAAAQSGCKIVKATSGGVVTFVIPKGYYRIKAGCDLILLTEANMSDYLEPISGSEAGSDIDSDRVSYIESNYPHILSGDEWDNSKGTRWTLNNGKLSDGYPFEYDDAHGTHQVNWSGNGSLTAYNVQLYVTDCSNWEKAFQGGNNAVYQAQEIDLRYVNEDDFVIPKKQTVTFQADVISLSMEFRDDEVGENADDRPGIQGHDSSEHTRFILKPLHGNKVQLYVPNELNVRQNKNHVLYTIQPGYYEVPEMDLLSDDAKDFFSGTTPNDPPSGGSGDGTLTGGVYTDGK